MGAISYKGNRYGGGGGAGGHTIITSSDLPMAGQPNLKFDGMNVDNDNTNHATVVHSPIKVCATAEEWNQKSAAEKNDPNVTWLLPWKTSGNADRREIYDAQGNPVTDRSKIQFIGCTTQDDSTNQRTKVTVDVVNEATQGETKPISSGAVYTILGDIETLLESI